MGVMLAARCGQRSRFKNCRFSDRHSGKAKGLLIQKAPAAIDFCGGSRPLRHPFNVITPSASAGGVVFLSQILYTNSMPIFAWSVRRQLVVIGIFAVFVFLIVGGLIYYFQPEPTCFDKRQNQDEESVDCGGSFPPFSEKIHNLTILWSRVFSVREGSYDAAALVDNQNQFLASKKLVYAFKLYDKDNILVAIRENFTFVNAGEKLIVFEPNFPVQNRIPARAVLELREVRWEAAEPEVLPIDILSKDLSLENGSTRLEVRVKNRLSNPISNIEISAAISDASGAVLGVSATKLDLLDIFAESHLVFTWPKQMSGATDVQIFFIIIP